MNKDTREPLLDSAGDLIPQHGCRQGRRIFHSPRMVGPRFQDWGKAERNKAARMLLRMRLLKERAGRVIRWQRVEFHFKDRPATRWAVEVEWR